MKLEGVKVLDLSMFLPGPHLTMMMADHGAEVIRIEPPAGEPTRSLGASQNGMTVWFRNTHRSKQSVVLDLKQPAAVEAFMRLAATADVVVEAFRPGVVDRLGIGPKAVRAVNPRIVYCSISAFGQSGPLAQRPAHDLSIARRIRNRQPQSRPRRRARHPRHAGGRHGELADGALGNPDGAAAAREDRPGRHARHLDAGQHRLLDHQQRQPGLRRRPRARHDDRANARRHAFYNVYRCADGRSITLGGSELKFCENVLKALGRPDLLALCRLPPGRGQDPVHDFLAATFLTRPARRMGALLRRHRLLLGAGQGLRRGDAAATI